MAYEINVHVDKSGKLEADQFPLELSVYRESKRFSVMAGKEEISVIEWFIAFRN